MSLKPEDLQLTLAQLSPQDEVYRETPDAVLDGLRAFCPVHRDDVAGNWILTRYADVRGVANDRSLWKDPIRTSEKWHAVVAGDGPDVSRTSVGTIFSLDDPDHTRVRTPLAQALYARSARFRPQIERIVDDALDALPADKPFDLITEFCVPIPIDVIASILGVDRDRLGQFRQWSEDLIRCLYPVRTPEQNTAMEHANSALLHSFADLLEARRTQPADDLVSDLIQLQVEGAELSDVELCLNLSLFLLAGNLTTTDLIGSAVWLLLTHPAELAKLKDDPTTIKAVVEEALRLEPPVEIVTRFASAEMDLGGRLAKPGASLTGHVRAANHDPESFEDPHRFDPSRKHKSHLAFGGGSHLCIGATLARLEAQVAVGRLFARFPDLRLADPAAGPIWRTIPQLRGLERLDVVAG